MQPLKSSYLAASAVARAMPARVRRGIGAGGGRLWYWASLGQARNTRRNYAAVLGLPPNHPDVRRRARLAYEYLGEMMTEFLLIPRLTPEEVRARMTYSGTEHIDAALAKGKGCILTLPHMGNWDLAAATAAVIGYKLYAIALPFPGSLNEAVFADRERFGMHIIPLDRMAFRRGVEVLKENALLALATDIAHSGRGVEVEMFGCKALIPAGPARFSLETGAPVLPVAVRRVAPGRYEATVGPPVEVTLTGDRKRDTSALSQAIVDRFEEYIRETPEQWFALRPILQPA